MTKHDLQDRPIWHRQEDAINAHLTVIFAALAIGRHLQELSGMSLKKLITTLKAIKSAKILINVEEITIPPTSQKTSNQHCKS